MSLIQLPTPNSGGCWGKFLGIKKCSCALETTSFALCVTDSSGGLVTAELTYQDSCVNVHACKDDKCQGYAGL